MIILGNIWVLKQLKCEKRLLVSHSFHFIVAAENDKRSFLTVARFKCFYVLGQVFSFGGYFLVSHDRILQLLDQFVQKKLIKMSYLAMFSILS